MGPIRLNVFLYSFICAAIVMVAAYLRVENSLVRQYHADEGVQSFQAWKLIEGGAYRYDPEEHHGPTLYYLTQWAHWSISDSEGQVSDFRMRLVPMAFSLGALVFGLWAFRGFGRAIAACWAVIGAIAPIAVIYGSYYIQESLLLFFTIGSAYAVFRYLEKPSSAWAIALGMGLGLMHVTKETAALHVFALLVALVATGLLDNATRAALAKRWWRDAGVAVALVALLHVLFFSSFFSNPAGIADALYAFFNYANRAQGQGHEKETMYYLSLLLPHTREGVRWSEAAWLCAVAFGGARIILDRIRNPSSQTRFAAYFVCFGLASFVLYSAIPYKTPWLLLIPYVALSYAAAYGVARLFFESWGSSSWGRIFPMIAGLLLLVWLGSQMASQNRLAISRFHSASRNPYLYEHTTGRYDRLLARIERVVASSPTQSVSIGVYGSDGAWPLPWHLREFETVGYWNSLETFTPHDIDIIDTRLLGDDLPDDGSGAFWELHGLRPNTLLSLRISEELKHVIINP